MGLLLAASLWSPDAEIQHVSVPVCLEFSCPRSQTLITLRHLHILPVFLFAPISLTNYPCFSVSHKSLPSIKLFEFLTISDQSWLIEKALAVIVFHLTKSFVSLLVERTLRNQEFIPTTGSGILPSPRQLLCQLSDWEIDLFSIVSANSLNCIFSYIKRYPTKTRISPL